MSARIKSSMVAAVSLLLCVSSFAGADDTKVDIAGDYRCVGNNPDGGEYVGAVKITKQGASYHIRWTIGGGEAYEGAGILDGDTFSVGWSAGGAAGVVSYKLQKDKKTLVGKWAVLGGDGKVFKETLTKTTGNNDT